MNKYLKSLQKFRWSATAFVFPDIGPQIGLGSADLKESVLNLIQVVLGFLPLVAVTMIIIGGFMWLTSGGNEERVDKAKHTISSAVVGLIVVLLAWAVVTFFFRTTVNVTQP